MLAAQVLPPARPGRAVRGGAGRREGEDDRGAPEHRRRRLVTEDGLLSTSFDENSRVVMKIIEF